MHQPPRSSSLGSTARFLRLILADEPTAALDKQRGRAVMELFHRVAHAQGAAVLVVTHDLRTLDAFDVRYEMEDGRLAA